MTCNPRTTAASPLTAGLAQATQDDADFKQTTAEQAVATRLADAPGSDLSTKTIGELVSLQAEKVFDTIFRTDDILFAKLRPNLRKSVRAPFDGYCSTDILVLRCLPGLLPEYAGHLFQTDTVFRSAAASAAGTRMPRTSWADLKRTRVFVPETEAEQRRIAGFLSVVEQAIEKREAIIKKLKQLRTGLLHDLLTRGIDENGELRGRACSGKDGSPCARNCPAGWQTSGV